MIVDCIGGLTDITIFLFQVILITVNLQQVLVVPAVLGFGLELELAEC